MIAYRFLGLLLTISMSAGPLLADDKTPDINKQAADKSEAPATDAPQSKDLSATRAQIEQAWSKHESLMVQVHSRVQTPNALRSMELTGTIWVRRTDGDDLQRSDTTIKTTLGEGEHASSTFLNKLEVFDGSNAYQLLNQGKESRLIKLDPVRLQRVAGTELVDQLAAFSELSVLSERVEEGVTFIVLEAIPHELKHPLHAIHVYIDKSTGVMRRLIMLDADAAEIQKLNLYDAEFNREIDPKLFAFTPPAEITLEDQTTGQRSESIAPEGPQKTDLPDALNE